ncbi:MlaD family protein [Thiohalobacter sp. IOR34]|uniref:MlaD family protein n=1 Tax=Thiohalobacter sp. IOR34 TaxID=3057176 RepID=UPI0025B13477|nr:MlaD family protein [Thiohalobacter sp. IOR34]WJW76251.1 MlaD family protein [Thiohalobacter sp. IOR34]
METRIQYVLVGLFVVVLGALGIGISLWLAFGDFAQEYRLYHVYMTESVSGLYVDAPVRFRGVEVGKVRALALDPENPERVVLTLAVKPDVPIHVDTVATLNVQGLTGIASIELSGGRRDSPLLEARPGEEYPVIHTGPSLFRRLDASVSELLANLNQVSRDLHSLLSPENRVRFANLLGHLEALSASLSSRRTELAEGIGHASTAFARLASAGETLPVLMQRLESSAMAVEGSAGAFAEASRVLKQEAGRSGAELRRIGSELLPQVSQLLEELSSLTGSLQRISERIEEDPRSIIYGPQLELPGPGEERP